MERLQIIKTFSHFWLTLYFPNSRCFKNDHTTLLSTLSLCLTCSPSGLLFPFLSESISDELRFLDLFVLYCFYLQTDLRTFIPLAFLPSINTFILTQSVTMHKGGGRGLTVGLWGWTPQVDGGYGGTPLKNFDNINSKKSVRRQFIRGFY